MSYPLDIKDCAKEPSKGGLPLNELRKLASEMGVDHKGLSKIQICEQIKKVLYEGNVSYAQTQMYAYPVYSSIVKGLSFNDLISLCQTNKEFQNICKEKHIWLEWAKEHSKKQKNDALLTVAKIGNLNLLEWLIEAGADVNTCGKKELALEILEAMGIETDDPDYSTELSREKLTKISPLTVAIEHKNNNIVKKLLDLGANPDGPEFPDMEGDIQIYGAPVKTALITGNTEALRLLLEHGADAAPGVYDSDARICDSPLGLAINSALSSGKLDQVFLLLKFGAAKNMYKGSQCVDSTWIYDLMFDEYNTNKFSEAEMKKLYDLIIDQTSDSLEDVFDYYEELFANNYDDFSEEERKVADYFVSGFKKNAKTPELYEMLSEMVG